MENLLLIAISLRIDVDVNVFKEIISLTLMFLISGYGIIFCNFFAIKHVFINSLRFSLVIGGLLFGVP